MKVMSKQNKNTCESLESLFIANGTFGEHWQKTFFKLNELEKQDFERQDSWQLGKHGKLPTAGLKEGTCVISGLPAKGGVTCFTMRLYTKSLALRRVPGSLPASVPLPFCLPPHLNNRPLIGPPIPYSPLHLSLPSLHPASCPLDTPAPQCSHAPLLPPPPPPLPSPSHGQLVFKLKFS